MGDSALGGMSGAIAAAATTPADVLKTRAMTGQTAAGEAMWVSVQNIVKKEVLRALQGCHTPHAVDCTTWRDELCGLRVGQARHAECGSGGKDQSRVWNRYSTGRV